MSLNTDDFGMTRVRNDNLVCRDCIHRLDDEKVIRNTLLCKKYGRKPNSIITGGECAYYEKEGD